MRGWVVAFLLLGCRPVRTPESAEPVRPENPAFLEHTNVLRATLARNGIELETEGTIMTCESADANRKCARCDVATGIDGIDPELLDRVALTVASYPDALLRAAHIERFALCRELRAVGEDDGPVGLAELGKRRIMIAVGYFNRDGRGVEHTVHHEIFHLFDYATLGGDAADSEWTALLPRGFQYRDPATVTPAPKGFVDTYATTNEKEDRASVYAYMMDDPSLCATAAKDPVVAAKVKLVAKRIAAVAGNAFLTKHVSCTGSLRPAPKKPPAKKPNLKLPSHYNERL